MSSVLSILGLAPLRELPTHTQYPGPPHLVPKIAYAAPCVSSVTGSRDIAAALTDDAGLHHVWQLCDQGWHHAVSADLVYWSSRGIGPDDWPSGFATVDEATGSICVGMQSNRTSPGSAHSWDAALALRCAVDKDAVQWGAFEPMFNVTYNRMLPYDPFRPFQDHDGQWYAGIAADGCNTTTRRQAAASCALGGQVDLWTSAKLRGAPWTRLPPLFGPTNRTIFGEKVQEQHEMVTIDYLGGLPGDFPEARVLLNNAYFARGATEYFIGAQREPGAPLEVNFSSAHAHSMLDWGEFQPTAAEGVGLDALNFTTMASPSGGSYRMTRTLSTVNQIARQGRRVAVAYVGGAGPASSMSLPRDLALRRDSVDGAPRLEQRFVPEVRCGALIPCPRCPHSPPCCR